MAYGDYDGPDKPDKGMKGGSCNRRLCQDSPAVWFNQSTLAYYCRSCARAINSCNRIDSQKLYGGPLCVEHGTDGIEEKWQPIETAPEDRLVMTKIKDERGVRNIQRLMRMGKLWWVVKDGKPEMYVYYSPTHWRSPADGER
jgi:hypothetical protein